MRETEERYVAADGSERLVHVVSPDGAREAGMPAVVLFHGGAWHSGKPDYFLALCRYLAPRGMVAASASYRLLGQGADAIDDCVADARCAIRWMRTRADIDPARVAAGGNSAGGQMALCAALLPEAGARPDAVVALGAGIHLRLATHVSPDALVRPGAPPTLIVQGARDRFAAPLYAKRFAASMVAAGNDCRIELVDGAHTAFAYRSASWPTFKASLALIDDFLTSLGFLHPDPDLESRIAAFPPPGPSRRRAR